MLYYILFNTFLVALGCVLPWLHPGLFVVGLRGIDMVDGKLILGLALIGLLAASYQLLQKRGRFYWIYGLIGFLIFIISALDLYTFYQNRYPMGPGIYLAALGGLQLTGAYLLMLFRQGRGAPPPV
ncbi:MAG: hypothetical protein EPO39_13370 [Candidatus Manganitrophaceae bacterium]|nr:MAG: hypothetical protein EPO39_13370 [Candidatus Manganitrophaceae bacterium]